MRALVALCLVALPFASAVRAQNAYLPAIPAPGDPPPPKMVPPTPPPGYTSPIPRGDPLEPTDPIERRFGTRFAQAAEAGGQGARTFNENFDGDFGGGYFQRLITPGVTTRTRGSGF